MIIDLPLFALAVVLLWVPRSWLRLGLVIRRHRRHRSSAPVAPSRDGSSLSFGREFRRSRNYYDLLRSAAGTLVLLGGWGMQGAVRVASAAARPSQVLAVEAGVLMIGVLLQTVRFERHRFSLAAPVFYLGGVGMITTTPWAGVCAFVIAWALSPIVPNAQGFLSILALGDGAFGVLFRGLGMWPLLAVTLCFLPVLLSLLARRPLMVFSHRAAAPSREVKV
ncbi:MAG TPA: hypothetical protein VHE61_07500 [Opitutaceae bacterium]|nr:hypothetical protein [Opitutaceae bacterium]